MAKGVVQGVLENVNSILNHRDLLGAALKPVYFVTRTWSGTELGDGTVTETRSQMLPSPRVVEFSHDVRLTEGGNAKKGDIMLKMVSKQTYPTQDLLDCTTPSANIEKLYEVGGVLYRVANINERHVTWNLLLKRLTQQSRV